jgi:hypothetical protein
MISKGEWLPGGREKDPEIVWWRRRSSLGPCNPGYPAANTGRDFNAPDLLTVFAPSLLQ